MSHVELNEVAYYFATLTITRSPMFCPNTNDPLEGFAEDLTRQRFLYLKGKTYRKLASGSLSKFLLFPDQQ